VDRDKTVGGPSVRGNVGNGGDWVAAATPDATASAENVGVPHVVRIAAVPREDYGVAMIIYGYDHPRTAFEIHCPKCGAPATFKLSATARLRNIPKHWKNSPFLNVGNWGVCQCDACVSRFDHKLNWPADACWKVCLREGVLWGHTRGHIVALRDYITANRHNPLKHRYPYYLQHVPKEFLAAKRRQKIVAALTHLLESGPAKRDRRRRSPKPTAKIEEVVPGTESWSFSET
jgi:hypothetical protein